MNLFKRHMTAVIKMTITIIITVAVKVVMMIMKH